MKTVDFSETIEACDLKVGRYRQLIETIGPLFNFESITYLVKRRENVFAGP